MFYQNFFIYEKFFKNLHAWDSKYYDCIQKGNQAFSYTFYATELGLVDKSPYVAGVNPQLHPWSNIIGCLQLTDRCKNARLVGDINKPAILTNDMVIE